MVQRINESAPNAETREFQQQKNSPTGWGSTPLCTPYSKPQTLCNSSATRSIQMFRWIGSSLAPGILGSGAPGFAGNYFSKPVPAHLDPAQAEPVKLELSEQVGRSAFRPILSMSGTSKSSRALLTNSGGRPMFFAGGCHSAARLCPRAAAHLSALGSDRGFGTRYTRAGGLMREMSGFRKLWLADDTPRFLALQLDGDGPYGDPYQVNSANSGPYGDAVTQELIPYVDVLPGRRQPDARFLDGGSTGGWVSLALQIFYPDVFNGTWSVSPDPVDFRAYQLVNIYQDKNAYVNSRGFERASERDTKGETLFTMRHECQMEKRAGRGRQLRRFGRAVGGVERHVRQARTGRPPDSALESAHRGDRHKEAEAWKKYDLRLYLEANWKTLAPRLKGKIHLWVGDADNYFLNNAVHLLDASLAKADPPFEGSIKVWAGPGAYLDRSGRIGKCCFQMQAAFEKGDTEPHSYLAKKCGGTPALPGRKGR